MPTWLEDIAGPGYAGAVMWTLVALVALGVIMLLVRIVRKVSSGSYNSSGNYRARLAVMDAAEVDAQRRLVLVRRDEVEHLIMIGGPSDIVIEQNIVGPGRSHPPRTSEPQRRASEHQAATPRVEPAPVATERPAQPTRPPRAVPPPVAEARAPAEKASPAPAVQAESVRPENAPAVRSETERVEPQIAQRVAATAPSVDEGMVSEFERDFRQSDKPAPTAQRVEPSIEDEMDRLLNEPAPGRR
jgi:hypothetical protein